MSVMSAREESGPHKVRLMAAAVGAGIALIVLGLFTSGWFGVLGAVLIGATPVYFTLRMALAAPRRPPKKRYDALGDDIVRMIDRVPPGPDTRPRRRDGHHGDKR